jgi:hypothetical protein
MNLYQIYENIPMLAPDYSNIKEHMAYIEANDCDNKLFKAVVDRLDMDEINNIINYANDKRTYKQKGHVMSGGFSSFVYNHENIAFYEIYSSEIWDLFYQEAIDMGGTTMGVINNIEGMADCVSDTEFKTLLVWDAVVRSIDILMQDVEG